MEDAGNRASWLAHTQSRLSKPRQKPSWTTTGRGPSRCPRLPGGLASRINVAFSSSAFDRFPWRLHAEHAQSLVFETNASARHFLLLQQTNSPTGSPEVQASPDRSPASPGKKGGSKKERERASLEKLGVDLKADPEVELGKLEKELERAKERLAKAHLPAAHAQQAENQLRVECIAMRDTIAFHEAEKAAAKAEREEQVRAAGLSDEDPEVAAQKVELLAVQKRKGEMMKRLNQSQMEVLEMHQLIDELSDKYGIMHVSQVNAAERIITWHTNEGGHNERTLSRTTRKRESLEQGCADDKDIIAALMVEIAAQEEEISDLEANGPPEGGTADEDPAPGDEDDAAPGEDDEAEGGFVAMG